MDREDEVSKIFIISLLCLKGSTTISIHEEQIQIFEGRKQNQSIWNRFQVISTL